MINQKVRTVVNSIVNNSGLKEANQLADQIAEKLTELFINDTVNLCMEDYKRQGNYGAGYRIAQEVKSLFTTSS